MLGRVLLRYGAALASIVTTVSGGSPTSSITKFANLPSRIFYFEDSSTVLYHDPVLFNVHISKDEGKEWVPVQGVPEGEAALLIEHPFDSRMAFILSKGKLHYRTTDRGQTWQSFAVPVPPAFMTETLAFHADKQHTGYIIYQGTKCDLRSCLDMTWYTEDAFSTDVKPLVADVSKCMWAHNTKDFKHDAPMNLIFCVAFDSTSTNGMHSIEESRLFSSQDFFKTASPVDFGVNTKLSRGVVGLGVLSKFMVAAVRDLTAGSTGEMILYVSIDARTWHKALFPHASNSKLREKAYTIVESTTHSLAIDVLLSPSAPIGTLFVSNSNGTYFVESLKDTNRNEAGYVDYEDLMGLEGIGLANVVANAQEVAGRDVAKEVRSLITFDDGSSWSPLPPPANDVHGKAFKCNVKQPSECSLHLYSVTTPHNYGRVFSSPAPGYVMGVGSVGKHLLPYEDCDTFLSTDAGVTWKMVHEGAHKYEFGDQGSILVIVNDEEPTDHVRYSWDSGQTWHNYDFGIRMRARLLTTIPDSTSQKFMLLGSLGRKDQNDEAKHVLVSLDFASVQKRQCSDSDFEKWYARTIKNQECLMGHKQWYNRRKADADCYVGNKFADPIEHEDNCPCTDEDYECDYNYIKEGQNCVPVGPEPIPAGVCTDERAGQTYMGSSGFRLIPGNTCTKRNGVVKDDKISKDCSKAQVPEGEVSHQTFEFPATVVQHFYFRDSQTILVHLADQSVWQSSNEGYTWQQIEPDHKFVAIYMHTHSDARAYLLTMSQTVFYTTDTARSWNEFTAPLEPNRFSLPVISFHPRQSDWLIWTGSWSCESLLSTDCRAEAWYTVNHGRGWDVVDKYVRVCAWARDTELKIDEKLILCESYKTKAGNQNVFGPDNPLQLIGGGDFYRSKRLLFENVVGFAKFSEYLIVAEVQDKGSSRSLDLQVSLDGRTFATGLFPPSMRLDNHAYTILESSTDAVFLHLMANGRKAEWGNILKSNSNGTYFGLALENANRNSRGFVDFEKLIGLDGIAMVNVVSNTDEALQTGKKKLQTRITHNDGGSWKALSPPAKDSNGRAYECQGTKCALQIHGYTERADPRATYSSPSAVGFIIAVGNVGEMLAPYRDSDTFISRNAGFTWEEVHKDAHLWEFGDSGSVLVLVNDEEPVDHVVFSTDEGLSWREYKFGDKVRVHSIVTVPTDTSRKFILFGTSPRSNEKSVAIHIDFAELTHKKCVLSFDDPANDDFELWSPSEEREETCLFGRQTLYHRRVRDHNCYVGKQEKVPERIVKNCACTAADFECEFNHIRNADGECVLVPGAQALLSDDSCDWDQEFWYERTAYRKIPKSTCEGGDQRHHGTAHRCPGITGRSALFWWFIIFIPFAFTGLVAYSYYRRGGYRRGAIHLPEPRAFNDSGVLSTLASVPWFIIGISAAAWEWLLERLPLSSDMPTFRSRRGYRNVHVDEDAQVLRFEDED